ncbi:MAG: nuclear transport factor 2 family protein [Treponema sp.]|nr:nuclear transport factor 2 family protein [Treponema sp.]
MINNTNEFLVREYLDIAENASEDFERFTKLLDDECVWNMMPPGISITGIDNVKKIVKFAMKSRKHDDNVKVKINNWFTDGDKLCVEYFHAALITIFKIKVIENVCFVFEMKNGKFIKLNEYIDVSGSILIGIGLKMLLIIAKIKGIKIKRTCNNK